MEGTLINLVRRCPFRGSTSCMNGRTKPRERVEYTERAKRWLGSEEADSKKDHSNRSFTVPLVWPFWTAFKQKGATHSIGSRATGWCYKERLMVELALFLSLWPYGMVHSCVLSTSARFGPYGLLRSFGVKSFLDSEGSVDGLVSSFFGLNGTPSLWNHPMVHASAAGSLVFLHIWSFGASREGMSSFL